MPTTKPIKPGLTGILFVVGLCLLLVGVSAYYKQADPYCRYSAEGKSRADMAPECQSVAGAAEPTDTAP